jgi:hypothetical protein
MTPENEQLAGDALDGRAKELEIPRRTAMDADQKREAVQRVEDGEDPQAVSDDLLGADGGGDESEGAELRGLGFADTPDGPLPVQAGQAVASAEENAELEHTESGATTRDDATDAGVPMLPGDPDEPVGPEDALGEGPKRGDYAGASLGNPHESVEVEGGGEPVYRYFDSDGDDADEDDALDDHGRVRDGYERVQVDVTPVSRLQPQAARAADRGEVAGKKGGVDSADVA